MALAQADNASVYYAGGVQLLQREDSTVILPAALLLIMGTGVPANLLLLVVLVHGFRSGLVSEARALLANLCVTDLLLLTACVPVRAVTYHARTWTLGTLACRTAEWFQQGCVVAKALTLAAASHAQGDPARRQAPGPRGGRAACKLLLAWTLSLLLPVPELAFSELRMRGDLAVCVSEVPRTALGFTSVFSKLLPLAAYVVPAVFACACCLRTIARSEPRTSETAERQRRALTLLALTAVQTLLLLPHWGSWAWAQHSSGGRSRPPAALLVFAQVCVYFGSAASPALLLTAHASLRDGLARVCGVAAKPATVPDARPEIRVTRVDEFGRSLPELEHFWTARRDTLVAQDNDPLPWERVGESAAEL
ncbi:probable G-protein coupled receptor 151 protein [Denticeps clupeoides]|uniref:probable G-protein coupled receptor 151 protein n=1 Tax=Denticeps clupeoides TaxID=299321 RepID=UPI0010A3C2AA|nr:probable G-protein coupled receptor 151 protein [Denticeps clupeoides]